MRGRSALSVAAVAALIAAGCGGRPAFPSAACGFNRPSGQQATLIERALRSAPGAVALPDGTTLSTCVARAFSDSDIQVVGASFTEAADRLAARAVHGDRAALELGYLVGAAERGAAKDEGIADELINRLGSALAQGGVPASRGSAYARGHRAGREHG